MTQPTSFRDVEQLSAYLDNRLPPVDRQRLETRLQADSELRAILADLSAARTLLRKLPARKAPRNFRLTPAMAGIRPPLPRAFPVFRLASALAAVLLFFAFAANLTLPAFGTMMAAAPAPVAMQAAAQPAIRNTEPLQPAAPAAGMGPGAVDNGAAPAPTSVMGIGGGPVDTSVPSSTEPAALMAPQLETTSEATATPELQRMMPAATPSQEQPAPTENLAQPAPTESIEQPVPTETSAEPGPMAKTSDVGPTPVAPPSAPIQPLVPAWLQFGLLGLAVVTAGAAYTLRARAESAWFKSQNLPPARITLRQVFLFVLIALLVVALAIGIAFVSSSAIYAP